MPGFALPLAVALAVGSAAPAAFGPPAAGVDPEPIPVPAGLVFERDVRPILKAMCFHCHGEEGKPKGGLDLRLVRLAVEGGDSGPAVEPGHPDESLLWERVEADEMPEGPKKLDAREKAILRAWIEQGARTARPEPENPDDARYTEEELAFWSFQPVVRPEVPAVPPGFANLGTDAGAGAGAAPDPIDAFLAAKLAENGFPGFSPPASPRELIRRVTFDLIGLPPTPEEVDAFLAASESDPEAAYDALVDRLVADPRYGERWGRHWLDTAGYAETDGVPEKDRERPHAWKYRDYVVRSLNADKPYDQFLREQLAGDEMIPRPFDVEDPETAEKLVATGFLRMAPDVTEASDTVEDRHQAVADTLKVVSTTFLGLTLGCAQCHDHRYDPISIEDYYAFRAIFDPAFPIDRWSKPSARLVDVTKADVLRRREAIEAVARAFDEDLRLRRRAVAIFAFGKEIAKLPPEERETARAAIDAKPEELTDEQKAILARNPSLKSVDRIAGSLILYEPKEYERFKKEEAAIRAIRDAKPPLDLLMAAVEPDRSAAPTPVTRVLFRGDPGSPRDEVAPAEPFVVARHRAPELRALPPVDESRPTTGRRLALAERLVDGSHPLVARVAVNRVWHHHFGRGIVETPGDFGAFGARPTHPELLDWLASTFVEDGWSLKRLHKRILSTVAYRQASRRDPERDAADPDNRLLGRGSVRRLDAEALRDSILAVAGLLNPRAGGPSVPVSEDGDGQAVIGTRILNEGLFSRIEPAGDDAFRRSLYLAVRRDLPLPLLEAFDLPPMNPNCDRRPASNVAPQALLLLNDGFVLSASESLAARVRREAGDDPAARVDRAFRLLYAAPPTSSETASCLEFLETWTPRFQNEGDKDWLEKVRDNPAAAEDRAFAALAQVLLATNRFLHVD